MEGFQNNLDAKKVALANIEAIRGEMAMMGANDSEFPILDELIRKLHTGELTPEEAVKKAHQLINSKQDYH